MFHVFLLKTTKLIRHEELGIVLKDGVYRIRLKEPVWFDVNVPVMPVYWIAQLEKANRGTLFDLCFYLVKYLSSNSGVETWDSVGENYIYMNLEENFAHYKTQHGDELSEDSKAEMDSLEYAHLEFGKNGEATKFINRLNRAGSSKKRWLEAFDNYDARSPLEKDIYKWLALGKELILTGENMNNFISLPEEYKGQEDQYDELPVTADEAVKFLWRVDDVFHSELCSMCEAQTSSGGGVPFFMDHVIEKPSDFKKAEKCFPEILLEFLSEGRKLEKKYRNAFADPEKLKKILFKPKPLLEILCAD